MEAIARGVPYATDAGMRMSGEAVQGGYFDVPLITHVKDFPVGDPGDLPVAIGALWQGGCIGGVKLPEDFDFVLSLYPWEKYVLGPNTEREEVKMYDSLDQGVDEVYELASDVAARLDEGQKVLVHCQAGLNRSGLVTARALMLMGRTADEAITLLRDSRSPQVLCNQSFEDYLRGLDA